MIRLEPPNNVINVCKGCSAVRKEGWQRANATKRLTVGAFAKLAFEEPPYTEHMWVKVIEVRPEGKYLGMLDNDPVHMKKIAADDQIVFDHADIEDSLSPEPT